MREIVISVCTANTVLTDDGLQMSTEKIFRYPWADVGVYYEDGVLRIKKDAVGTVLLIPSGKLNYMVLEGEQNGENDD